MVYIGLVFENPQNLKHCLDHAASNDFTAVLFPIANHNFDREFEEGKSGKSVSYTRSPIVLEPNVWTEKVIPILSDDIDCDSQNEIVRRNSEKTLQQEIALTDYVQINGFVMIYLKSGRKSANLARLVSGNVKGSVLVHIPLVDPAIAAAMLREDLSEENVCEVGEDTWQWWNRFRAHAGFSGRLRVVLELSEDIPSQEVINRWLGEPVEAIHIPSHLFRRNKNNYPVLPPAVHMLLQQFLNIKVNFFVSANETDPGLRLYVDVLKHIGVRKNRPLDTMNDLVDVLEIPLQPLHDNLDSYTYDVFEKDPVKYKAYQDAIALALEDKVPESEIKKKTVIIMVLGAGRGPLVRAALNAAAKTKRKVRIYVIEKNPNAIITLRALAEEIWEGKDVHIVSEDMRYYTPPENADILVSELLGSFGDNELSPECLDGAQRLLKDDGISIPCQSTSYINPVMSHKLYNAVRTVVHDHDKPTTYASQAEYTYVVYIRNAYHIAKPKPLFVFDHPNRAEVVDNNRYKSVQFEVPNDCVLTGFAGYFETVLYKDIILSINPPTHTRGLFSWFPMYIPISVPQQLRAGDVLEVNFWRCVGDIQVWYEWSTTSPHITHVHNHKGKHCKIYK